MAIIVGSEPKYLHCYRKRIVCNLCALRENETPEHILFKCDALNAQRLEKLTDVINAMPSGMYNSVSNMIDYDKMVFFLSALNCDYLVEEWIPILLNICSFVHTMYEGRKRLYDQLDIDNRNISQDDS